MALFGTKKKKEETLPPQGGEQKKAVEQQRRGISSYAHIFLSPRITEKATMQEESGVYTFNITAEANKREIIRAIQQTFKVTPRSVRIVQIPEKRKRSMRTGKRGVKKGGKKAYVYLKRGDKITVA